MKTKNHQGKVKDPRPDAVAHIWWAALAMLAVCIPLCAVLRTASIPFVVLSAAAVCTFYIWSVSGRRERADSSREEEKEREIEALRDKVADLESRLGNVEVINTFEERLAERSPSEAEKAAH